MARIYGNMEWSDKMTKIPTVPLSSMNFGVKHKKGCKTVLKETETMYLISCSCMEKAKKKGEYDK